MQVLRARNPRLSTFCDIQIETGRQGNPRRSNKRRSANIIRAPDRLKIEVLGKVAAGAPGYDLHTLRGLAPIRIDSMELGYYKELSERCTRSFHD